MNWNYKTELIPSFWRGTFGTYPVYSREVHLSDSLKYLYKKKLADVFRPGFLYLTISELSRSNVHQSHTA